MTPESHPAPAVEATFPLTLPDEMRFLAAQCLAQAEGNHRDQDRQFVAGLVAQLAILGGPDAANASSLISIEAMRCKPEELPDLIRLAGTALRHGARVTEGKIRRRAA